MLNIIRWASEVRPAQELKLPTGGKAAAKLKPGDLKMAEQLIKDMTQVWKSEDYSDRFSAAIGELVRRKVKAGDTKSVAPIEANGADGEQSNVVDLTELLANSLARRKAAPAKKLARTRAKA